MMKEGHRLPQASEDVAKAPKNNKYKLNIWILYLILSLEY